MNHVVASARLCSSPPDVPIAKHACNVATPIASRPAQALLQKFAVIFQCSLNFCFLMILICDPLIMRYQPSRNEVIVVRIKLVLTEPFLVRETVNKSVILEDLRSIGNCSTRQTWQATVHVHASCTIEVSPFQVKSAEVAPESLPQCRGFGTPKPLIRTDAPITLVFQGGQHPWQQLLRPRDIVVRENRDLSLDLGNSTNHLASLVRMGHATYSNSVSPHALYHHLSPQ